VEANIGGLEKAHDSNIWDVDWHPLGHVVGTASNDLTVKFWTRNRPGDPFKEDAEGYARVQIPREWRWKLLLKYLSFFSFCSNQTTIRDKWRLLNLLPPQQNLVDCQD